MKYIIYGSDLSYFTQKTLFPFEWYLQNSEFEFRHVTMDMKEELQVRSGTHQIPVVVTPENWALADSTPIFRLLQSRLSKQVLYPGNAFTRAIVALAEEYFDEWTPRLAVHTRWHFAESAAFAAPVLVRDSGIPESSEVFDQMCTTIANWGGRACRATGIESKQQQEAGNQELLRIFGFLERHLKEHGVQSFIFGKYPSALDAVIAGSLRAHFLADPWPKQLLSCYPLVKQWLETTCTQKFDVATHNIVNITPNNMPSFVCEILKEMDEHMAPFVSANKDALATKQKHFTINSYGENVSYLARKYPESSRQMLTQWLCVNFANDKDGEAQYLSVLKNYDNLKSLYAPERLKL